MSSGYDQEVVIRVSDLPRPKKAGDKCSLTILTKKVIFTTTMKDYIIDEQLRKPPARLTHDQRYLIVESCPECPCRHWNHHHTRIFCTLDPLPPNKWENINDHDLRDKTEYPSWCRLFKKEEKK